jgi:hypothetical protein
MKIPENFLIFLSNGGFSDVSVKSRPTSAAGKKRGGEARKRN